MSSIYTCVELTRGGRVVNRLRRGAMESAEAPSAPPVVQMLILGLRPFTALARCPAQLEAQSGRGAVMASSGSAWPGMSGTAGNQGKVFQHNMSGSYNHAAKSQAIGKSSDRKSVSERSCKWHIPATSLNRPFSRAK